MSETEKPNKDDIQKSFEEEVAEAESNAPATKKVKPDWGPIVVDMVVLMIIAAVLGIFSKQAMKPFEPKYEGQDLVALVRKGGIDVRNWTDPAFDSYLQSQVSASSDFINCTDNTGRTPLMWICYCYFNAPKHLDSSTEKYMVLPPSVTDPKVLNEVDLKRLYYTRKLLAVPGIDVQAKDKDGFSALHWAAWSGMPFHCLLLAQLGLDINLQEDNGYTPLMLAAMRGNLGAVSMLLQLGADAAIQNKDGKTALDLAAAASAGYEKRHSIAYQWIYSEDREKEYKEVVSLLSNPPAKLTMEQLSREMEEVEQAYRNACGRVSVEEAKK